MNETRVNLGSTYKYPHDLLRHFHYQNVENHNYIKDLNVVVQPDQKWWDTSQMKGRLLDSTDPLPRGHLHKKKKNKKGQCDLMNKLMKKRKNKKKRRMKKRMKYVRPLLIGLLAAKTVLLPIVLKTLALISVKGLILGFFSTLMTSALSFRRLMDPYPNYHDKKDERTQIEVVEVPAETIHHYSSREFHEHNEPKKKNYKIK